MRLDRTMAQKILIIEDDKDIAALLEMHLRDAGHNVTATHDGARGLELAAAASHDILMLTAKSSELDRVLGLELGADDYLTKPFSIKELLARVKALFRRMDALESKTRTEAREPISVGDLMIDVDKRTVTQKGSPVTLTAKEFDLLLYFARHPGRVYTRSQLLSEVWGYAFEGYEHTVNSHINRLRTKIEKDPSHPRTILTVWGVGYKFADT